MCALVYCLPPSPRKSGRISEWRNTQYFQSKRCFCRFLSALDPWVYVCYIKARKGMINRVCTGGHKMCLKEQRTLYLTRHVVVHQHQEEKEKKPFNKHESFKPSTWQHSHKWQKCFGESSNGCNVTFYSWLSADLTSDSESFKTLYWYIHFDLRV